MIVEQKDLFSPHYDTLSYICNNCGRPIWAHESQKTGYGIICRQKLGIKSVKGDKSQMERLKNSPEWALNVPFDGVLSFKGLNGFLSEFRLQLYAHNGKIIAIATEIPSNEGTSITNCAENLASKTLLELCRFYEAEIKPDQLVWVEHYTTDSYDGRSLPEEWSIVRFDVNPGVNIPDMITTQHKIPGGLMVRNDMIAGIFSNPQWQHVEKSVIDNLIGK